MIELSSKFLTLITLYNFFFGLCVLIIPSDLINLFFTPLLPYFCPTRPSCCRSVLTARDHLMLRALWQIRCCVCEYSFYKMLELRRKFTNSARTHTAANPSTGSIHSDTRTFEMIEYTHSNPATVSIAITKKAKNHTASAASFSNELIVSLNVVSRTLYRL